ncbi:serine hydrolase [Phenylobacterium sp.]|uniref:serine hydrolase n=1 Tax=Phenylobacterium sp. TaxID=1871053 RepID=UPI0039835E56
MSKAKSLGFSAERLQRIDRFLQDGYVGPRRLACAQFVLARQGQVVHHSVQGQRDLERGAALTNDTVFRIYSMNKPVTCVALMTRVEEPPILFGGSFGPWPTRP